MTDRELLELAGLAAGETYSQERNPLERDDLALRLAVKLDICVEPYSPEGSTIAYLDESVHKVDEKCESPREWYGTDPYAATRRAVVRAAAQIGKGVE